MRLAILDRDGVINQNRDDYIRTPEQWRPIPGSLEAIARLCRAEYRVLIATNQSGVGRGLYTLDMMNKINARMFELVRQKGGEIDALLFCPHAPDAGCACRKPRPGLLHEIARRLKVNLTGIPVVGDSIGDLEAAVAVGAKPVLVRTGRGMETLAAIRESEEPRLREVPVYDDLAAFVEHHMLDDDARATLG